MATDDGGNRTVIDALALQTTAEILIDKGQYEALKFLLSKYKLDVDKHFLLHRALVAQKEDIAKLLVESGADVNNYREADSGYRDWEEQGCDHYSCYLPLQLSLFCSFHMTRFLLESGADVDSWNPFAETTLEFICRMSVVSRRVAFLLHKRAMTHVKECDMETANDSAAQIVERVTLLIDHGADIERGYLLYGPALIISSRNSESFECLETLLEKGAFCRITNAQTHETGLHEAAKSGNSMALKLLIQYGAQLEARTSKGDTALILACGESVAAECVKILLENGAFPNVRNIDKETPLNLAMKTKNEEKIQMLVQYGATEEDRMDKEETDLMLACGKTGNVKSVLSLLERNASPNIKNKRGETALHVAANTGDIEILKLLVQYKADVNAMTDDGETPLMLACANSSVNAECVKFLLENKALLYVTDKYCETAFMSAIYSGDVDKLKLLVQYGVDVNTRDGYAITPLMLACFVRSPNIECVKFLLENKALPNVADLTGVTALHRAVPIGDLELLKILVQYGADVNATTKNKETPLILACKDNSVPVECVKFLLENKALPNVIASFNERPPLHMAITWGETEKVKILIQYGADVNMRSTTNQTPLFACLYYGDRNNSDWVYKRSEVIKLFVKQRADLEAKVWGDTVFLHTARMQDRKLIELLHDLGADGCAEDGEGRNAVMIAMGKTRSCGTTCDLELLQYLIDKGVSVNHCSKNGWTPLMLAALHDQVKTIEFLIQAGADANAVAFQKTERGKEEVSALSISLDFIIRGNRLDCTRKLIRSGALKSLPERYNSYLFTMLRSDNREMIQLLLTNGMAPTMSHSAQLFPGGPAGPVSPLIVAICNCNIPVIQYLLGNWMLCPCDIYGHSYFNEWRHMLVDWNWTDVVIIMDDFYSQPKSLFQLSFITVSHALGGVPGRVDRVNSLPLPSKVKDKLLFKSIDVPMKAMHSDDWEATGIPETKILTMGIFV